MFMAFFSGAVTTFVFETFYQKSRKHLECPLGFFLTYIPAGITYSKLTIETLEQGQKYVQS